MARFAVFILLFLCCFFSSTQARKLLGREKAAPSLEASLVLSALPKGTVPPSAPSEKAHRMIVDQRLFAFHLATIDRILQSVPSPGAGH